MQDESWIYFISVSGVMTTLWLTTCTVFHSYFDQFTLVHYIWAAPLQVIVCLLLLLKYLGYSSLAGFTLMLLFLPLGGFIAKIVGKFSKNVLEFTDKRVKLLNEILQGIRIVKVDSSVIIDDCKMMNF